MDTAATLRSPDRRRRPAPGRAGQPTASVTPSSDPSAIPWAISTCSSRWPSSSSARSPPSANGPSSSSVAARTRPSCAPGGQGLQAREDPLPGAPRRHRAQLPRGPRLPRRARWRRWAPGSLWPRCRTPSTGPGGRPGPSASRNRLQTTTLLDAINESLRRRIRRGPPRRGQGAGQGAGAVVPRLLRPVGSQAAAARALAALPGQRAARRAPPRLPPLGLHRARHLAVHRAGSRSRCRRSTTPTDVR